MLDLTKRGIDFYLKTIAMVCICFASSFNLVAQERFIGIWDLELDNEKIKATLFVPPFKGDSSKATIKLYAPYNGLKMFCTMRKMDSMQVNFKLDSMVFETPNLKLPNDFIRSINGLYNFKDSFANNSYYSKNRFHYIEKLIPNQDSVIWGKKLEFIPPGFPPKVDSTGQWQTEENRKKPVIKSITVYRKNIEIEVWDHNEEDGDTISIKLNDKWVLQEFPLKKEKYKFSIILEQKNNVLLMFAENVGSIFPNTASISFFDGVQRQYAKVNSDYTRSECIRMELYGAK